LSVAGSVFSAAVLAAGLDRPLEDVEAWCDRLGQRGQFLHAQGAAAWPDGTVTTRYGFGARIPSRDLTPVESLVMFWYDQPTANGEAYDRAPQTTPSTSQIQDSISHKKLARV